MNDLMYRRAGDADNAIATATIEGRTREFGERNNVPGRLLVRMRIEEVATRSAIA